MLDQNAIVILVMVTLVLMGAVVFTLRRRARSAHKLYPMLEELQSFLAESNERLELISPHAHEYFNSLGGEGARTYAHLTRILGGIEKRIETVQHLISIGSKPAIAEAAEILISNFTFEVGSMSSVLGEERFPDLPLDRIEMTVEKLFQDLGKRIATASFSAGLQHITTKKQRKDTFQSLVQARINVTAEEDFEEEEEEED